MGILDLLIGKRIIGDEKRRKEENIPVRPQPRHLCVPSRIYDEQEIKYKKYMKER